MKKLVAFVVAASAILGRIASPSDVPAAREAVPA